MNELDRLELNMISYEWLEKTNDPKLLKKAIKLLKDDGGYFPDLEKAIDNKLRTIDLKYKKNKETQKVSQEDIEKCKQEMLQFEEEFNKKDKILSESKDSKETKNYDVIKIQRKQEAESEKIKGNELMKTKEYDEAIKHYTKSISLDEFEPTTYANRALAYLKNTEYGRGLDDCNRALDLKNDYIKAYYRRGMCYTGLKKFKEGLLDFLYVLNDNPQNNEILSKIKDLNDKWKKFDNDGYEACCKRMTVNLNRAKEGKYLGDGNITYKEDKDKGIESFTKVQIVEESVDDGGKKNINMEGNAGEDKEEDKKEEKKGDDKKDESKKEEDNKKTAKEGGFKKIKIVEED